MKPFTMDMSLSVLGGSRRGGVAEGVRVTYRYIDWLSDPESSHLSSVWSVRQSGPWTSPSI